MMGCIATLLVYSCGGGRSHNKNGSSDSILRQQRALPLPQVPPGITDVSERADYVACHFWDALDFSDQKVFADTEFLEQTFSNYISILPVCGDEGLVRSVSYLLNRAHEDGKAEIIMRIAEKYLWESDSPFRSERLYTPFVEYAVSHFADNKDRYQEILLDISKNKPGSMASGFSATGRNGGKIRVEPRTDNKLTVVMFYEPDCEQCKASISRLSADPILDRLVGDGSLRFIAVYVGENIDLWKKYSASLPENWEVGVDELMDIDKRDLYQIRATPSFYVIGEDGRIIIKDGGIQEVLSWLGEN